MCTWCLHSRLLKKWDKWKRNKRNGLCFNEFQERHTQQWYWVGGCDPSKGLVLNCRRRHTPLHCACAFAHLASSGAVLKGYFKTRQPISLFFSSEAFLSLFVTQRKSCFSKNKELLKATSFWFNGKLQTHRF